MTSVLRLVSGLLALALFGLALMSVVPSAASASPGNRAATHAKHSVAKASPGVSVHATLAAPAQPDSWASVDDDDDDDDRDDCDDGDDDDCNDDVAPASRLPLPILGERSESGFGLESPGRALPGARELPENPPEPA